MRLVVLALVVALAAGCSGGSGRLSQDQLDRIRFAYCEGIDLGTYPSQNDYQAAMNQCMKAAEDSLHHGSTIPKP